MTLQLIATQSGIPTVLPQPNSVKVVLSPGWELMLELFSQFNTQDSHDYSADWGQVVIDQFDLLDAVQKEAVLNLATQVGFSDEAVKEFVKIVNDAVTVTDSQTKEFTKHILDQMALSDVLSTVSFFALSSTLTMLDKVKIVFASHSGGGGGSNIHHGAQGLNKTRAADTSVPKATTGTESDSNKYSGMESDPKIYTEEDSQNI